MKIYLDSASIEDAKKAVELGFIDGVTTNPLLLSKQKQNYKQGIKEIVSVMGERTVFAEVLAQSADEMCREAREISTWGPNIVIKIPITNEGLRAVYRLRYENIDCAVTLIYSTAQALISAHAGAKYVAPFIARSFEVGQDGFKVVAEIAQAFKCQNLECQIVAASLRTPFDAARCLSVGSHSVTLPYAVLSTLSKNPTTDLTLNTFLKEWNNIGKGGVFETL